MRTVFLLAVLAASCVPEPPYMRPAAGPTAACGSDAFVVFVRPTVSMAWPAVEIREADGTYLGRLPPRSYFGVAVSPGEHFFMATAANALGTRRAVAVQATLGAGRTYVVEAESQHGKPILVGVGPRHESWKGLDAVVEGCSRLEPDPPLVGQPPLPLHWDEVYEYASRLWASLDEQEVAERSLVLSDGSLGPPSFATFSGSCARRPRMPAVGAARPRARSSSSRPRSRAAGD